MNLGRTPDPLGKQAGDIFLRTLEEMPKTPGDTGTNIDQIQSALRMAAAQTGAQEPIGRKR